MDFSVLADRDCLVAFAAVVLCSDRGVEAHTMGYDYGGIAHLTAKGAAGRAGLNRPAAGRALRRLEEAGLIIAGDGDQMPGANSRNQSGDPAAADPTVEALRACAAATGWRTGTGRSVPLAVGTSFGR